MHPWLEAPPGLHECSRTTKAIVKSYKGQITDYASRGSAQIELLEDGLSLSQYRINVEKGKQILKWGK